MACSELQSWRVSCWDSYPDSPNQQAAPPLCSHPSAKALTEELGGQPRRARLGSFCDPGERAQKYTCSVSSRLPVCTGEIRRTEAHISGGDSVTSTFHSDPVHS